MRLPVYSLALVCGVVVSCSSEQRSPTETPRVKPVAEAISLALSGSTPLFASRANAINDSGVVVGSAAVNAGEPSRAVVWRPPGYSFEFLPDQNAERGSSANAVGRDGVIAGQIGCGEGAVSCTPVYWREGVLHVLDGVGQANSVCPCDSHTLVGQVVVDGELHGALWIDDVLIDVGTPTGFAAAQLVSVAHGFIVGDAFGDTTTSRRLAAPFRWSPSSGWTQMATLGQGGGSTFVADVNASGTAAGLATVPVLWLNGSNSPTPLPNYEPEENNYTADAINDSSVVAGTFRGGGHPFPSPGIWTQANGWTPLGFQMFPVVMDINNSNQVVGFDLGGPAPVALLWEP
jgi:hypothetical protein